MDINKFIKKHKKMIFQTVFRSVVVFIFISAAFLLVLWASGYKYNRLTHKFQKTGLIFLVSQPKNVKVYINSKLAKEKTPARLDYILPGRYTVEIKKKGYYDWVKEIEVSAGKVKKYDEIILFTSNQNTQEILKQVNQYYLSPNKEKILILAEQPYLFNLQNNEKSSVDINSNLTFLSWSNDSNKILFSGPNQYLIYDINNKTLSPINTEGTQDIAKTYFNPKNSNQILYSKNNNLYLADLKNIPKLLTQNIYNIQATNDFFFFIRKDQEKFFLLRSDFDLTNSKTLAELKQDNYEIFSRNSDISLKNSAGILYLVPDNKLVKLNSSVKSANWSETSGFLGFNKKTKLAYLTSLDDIWYYDPENKNNNLILRSEKNIKKFIWYSELSHIIFNINQEIIITELDGKNQTKIADGVNPELISEKELLYLDPNKILQKLKIR